MDQITAREARAIIPTKQMYFDTVDYIVSLDWYFRPDCRAENPYNTGWWMHPDHPTKNRPVGDPGNFHMKAWDTFKTYVAQE